MAKWAELLMGLGNAFILGDGRLSTIRQTASGSYCIGTRPNPCDATSKSCPAIQSESAT